MAREPNPYALLRPADLVMWLKVRRDSKATSVGRYSSGRYDSQILRFLCFIVLQCSIGLLQIVGRYALGWSGRAELPGASQSRPALESLKVGRTARRRCRLRL